MRHVRSLGFEALEARELLSRAPHAAHHAVAHHAPAAAVPLVLNGTLTVDYKAQTSNTDSFGDVTTTIPVSGTLGALGNVRGVWSESGDAYGDYSGPDTVQLHNSQGSFVITFNNANPGKLQRNASGGAFYQHPQKVSGGTGAYAHATESGTIDLNTNASRKKIVSLTLTSNNS